MKEINLFIMDMASAENTTGVDRYINTLVKGLEIYPFISVCWIHLIQDNSLLFHTEEKYEHYTRITIPLPQQFNEIINERFWIRKYNEQVYRLVKHLFILMQNCILHTHTLNLIDLAVFIREHKQCKVITHLHCISWKGYYNTNTQKFNELYNKMYLQNVTKIDSHSFISNNCELHSYTKSNHIICVTRCAVDFLKKLITKPNDNITIIPNGINDCFNEKSINNKRTHTFNLLYVGVISDSKGLSYILEALRKVSKQGYNVSLTVAGKSTEAVKAKIKKENKDLTLNLLGRISFEELINYYTESDAGVIASLQEQSSYVAIEMAMFGLPVITTAVDGLDEIFTDNVNSLKVNTLFSRAMGLSADVDMMANKIIMLIEDHELREQLSKNVRELYQNELTLQHMMISTVNAYKKVIGGNEYE